MISAIAAAEKRKENGRSDDLPHVLLLIDQLPKVLGGGERIALKLAALLPEYGYTASILVFNAAPDSPALNSLPCPTYLLPLSRTYDWTAMRAARELRRFIRRERVQIVQTFFESSDLWGGLVAKMAGAKLIWNRRDMGILRQKKHAIAYRWMASLPDAVFAVSNQVRAHCIGVDGVDAARVRTVYNGLDLARWPQAARRCKNPGDATLVATVGNIRRVKGQDVFVRAAGRIAKEYPAARFSLAGDVLEPGYFEELKALVAELGLSDRFSFAGAVSDLSAYLAAADIFTLPSRSEGFSNAIIEAMAASLPVVATDVGGNSEAVQDGVNGLIVPAEDVDALTLALAKLLADPGTAMEMGEASRVIVSERFTVDAMMRRTVDVYGELLGRL